MQRHGPFLVALAVAVLIAAVSLSATAAVPRAGATLAQTGSAQTGSAQTGFPADTSGRAKTSGTGPVRHSSADSLGWPLAPRPQIQRRFEPARSQWAPGHRGVDLLAAAGQPVLSAGAGVVAFSGMVAGRGVVTIRHSGGLRTTYEPVSQRPPRGTLVHRGTKIGVVALAEGHCLPRPCLHWGAISAQTYRDPLSLLGIHGPAVLLPLG